MDHLLTTIRRVNRGVALIVGLILLACAGFVLLDIILRQAGASFGGTDEISGYTMAIATSWGMAFTMLELGHVRIDILRSRVRQRGRVMFDLFAMLVLSGVITLIALQCWPVLANSLQNASRANTPLETPLSWVQAPWFAGWAWFSLMAWLTLVGATMQALKGRFADAESAIGAFPEKEAL